MSAFAEAAAACLGTRFHWQGRQPGTGLDCGGLILAAAEGAGIAVDAPADYGRREGSRALLRIVREHMDRVAPSELDEGDVVLFEGRKRIHAGVCVSRERFVHAWEDVGRVVESRLVSWLPFVHSAWRLRGGA